MVSATDSNPTEARRPLMVVDDAHVEYRVLASGKKTATREKFSFKSLGNRRGFQVVPALRGVTFTAHEGETIGVVGHNGSGKSTLFRAMSGLIPTSEGKIWASDRPVLLGVNAALMPNLSGVDNIRLGLLAMGFSRAEAEASIEPIAEFAELGEFIHHPMRTYSSGMAARLRFAIGAAKTHSILLVDEALSVGDRRFKDKSDKRIRELRDSAGLVMIVSHSVGSLRSTCDRVLWIHKGELRADGPAKETIDEYTRWTKDATNVDVGAAGTTKGRTAADRRRAAARRARIARDAEAKAKREAEAKAKANGVPIAENAAAAEAEETTAAPTSLMNVPESTAADASARAEANTGEVAATSASEAESTPLAETSAPVSAEKPAIVPAAGPRAAEDQPAERTSKRKHSADTTGSESKSEERAPRRDRATAKSGVSQSSADDASGGLAAPSAGSSVSFDELLRGSASTDEPETSVPVVAETRRSLRRDRRRQAAAEDANGADS